MRAALVSMGVIAFALAGPAHAVECYASEYDEKIGDVSMTYELDDAGKVTSQALSWTVERTDGVESEFFARPGLMFDYKLDDAGVLTGPVESEMTISRVATGGRTAPKLAELQVKAITTGDPLVFDLSSQARGQQEIAKLVSEQKPAKLTLQLIDKTGKILAASTYDLSAAAKVEPMAIKAKTAADKRVAAFQAEAAKGTAPKTCPAA